MFTINLKAKCKIIKTTFSALILLFSIESLNAQINPIEVFSLSATGGTYGIYADINTKETDPFIYFDWESPNGFQKARTKISFKETLSITISKDTIRNSEVEIFIKSLETAKSKFEQWKLIAKNNNLKLLTKKLPCSFNDQYIFFSHDGKWYSESGVDIHTTFFINRNGDCYLILESDYMSSTEVVSASIGLAMSYTDNFDNLSLATSGSTVYEWKYCPGASLMFSTSSEIDEFIESLRRVVKWKKQNIADGKLFE